MVVFLSNGPPAAYLLSRETRKCPFSHINSHWLVFQIIHGGVAQIKIHWDILTEIPTNWYYLEHLLTSRQNYKYWVYTKGFSALSVAVARFCDCTVQFSPHYQHHLQHLTSSTSAEKEQFQSSWWVVSWPIFSRSLGCLKLFSDFHLSVFGHHSHGPTFLPDYHENHLTWVDSKQVGPHWGFT
jgi:hypothetical protein